MNNVIRIARWELLRNLTNKAFLISLLLTPVFIGIFSLVPSLITIMAAEEPFTIFIHDEYDIVDQIRPLITSEVILTVENDPARLESLVRETPRSGYIRLDSETIRSRTVKIYTCSEGELIYNNFGRLPAAIQSVFRTLMLREYGLSEDQITDVSQPFTVSQVSLDPREKDDPFKKYIPAIFAGILYFNMFISATLMYTSVTQEKKDRMAEIILCSVPARQFMQGKIFGYFLLSLLQIILWMVIAIPAVAGFLQIPILTILISWQLIPVLLFTFGGYILYFSCFAALGATVEDAHSGSNFQSIILMLPMLPIFCFGPVFVNPNGNVALFCSLFPLTSPLILPQRTALTSSIPLSQYLLGGSILVLTCFLIMVAGGRIFQASILLYGRNASVMDLFRWLRKENQ